MCEKQQTRQAVGLFYSSWPEKKLKEADVIVLWLTAVSFVVRAVLLLSIRRARGQNLFTFGIYIVSYTILLSTYRGCGQGV